MSGFIDFHLHVCRALTLSFLNNHDWGHKSLTAKQNIVGELHKLVYDQACLEKRIERVVETKIKAGEKEAWLVIDTTPDVGTAALDITMRIKHQYQDAISLKCGAYPVFGFKYPQSDRLQVFQEAAMIADFVVGLPERDVRDGHEISFKKHIKYVIDKAREHKIIAQIHLDQSGSPHERGTLDLIEVLDVIDSPVIDGWDLPTVWAVHVISPTFYPEKKFKELIAGLKRHNVGVVICPKAALSMRRNRHLRVPQNNMIARVLELILSGVVVRFGTDNVGDIFVGCPNPLLSREIEVAADSLRFYEYDVLCKIARGEELNETDMEVVRGAL